MGIWHDAVARTRVMAPHNATRTNVNVTKRRASLPPSVHCLSNEQLTCSAVATYDDTAGFLRKTIFNACKFDKFNFAPLKTNTFCNKKKLIETATNKCNANQRKQSNKKLFYIVQQQNITIILLFISQYCAYLFL